MCLGPLACKLEKGCPRLSSDALANENAYFKQYHPLSLLSLRGGGGGWPGPGPSQTLEGAPDPGCPWPRAGTKVMNVMTPCTCPSLPWKPLDSARCEMGCLCPMSLTSGPWSPFHKTERLAASVHLRQPLAARPGPAAWQAYQSLAQGPCHLCFPKGLDATCVFWSLRKPRCCKE